MCVLSAVVLTAISSAPLAALALEVQQRDQRLAHWRLQRARAAAAAAHLRVSGAGLQSWPASSVDDSDGHMHQRMLVGSCTCS